MKFYREGARRILAGQKKKSTILIGKERRLGAAVGGKNVDSKADG